MFKRALLVGACIAAMGTAAAACGNTKNDGGGDGDGGGGSSGGSTAGTSDGTSSGSTAGGTSGGDVFGIGGAGGVVQDLTGCATGQENTDVLALRMSFLIDTSKSMVDKNKWNQVRAALKSFARVTVRGTYVGMTFFPKYELCDPAAYAAYDVPITRSEEVGPLVEAAVDSQQPFGSSPFTAALDGTIQTIAASGADDPDGNRVIIFLTDGFNDPAECQPENTVTETARIAGDAYNRAASIPTYVVLIGGDATILSPISVSGGTEKVIQIDPDSNVLSNFLSVINSIRANARSCTYKIAAGGSFSVDPNKTNVTFTVGDETVVLKNAGSCAEPGAVGWVFDNPAAPSRIVLCPETCKRVNAQNGDVRIVIGCDQVK
jgi:hypothetical protein